MIIILISIALSFSGSDWDTGLGAMQLSMAGERALEVKRNGKHIKILIKFRERESGKAESLSRLHPLQSSVHLPYTALVPVPYHLLFHLWLEAAERSRGSAVFCKCPWSGHPFGMAPQVLHAEPQHQMTHFASSSAQCTPSE